MTLTERVLAHMEATKGEWKFHPGGRLRRGDLCPLESAGIVWQASYGRNIRGLNIMRTADNLSSQDPALRRAMLAAAGLEREALYRDGYEDGLLAALKAVRDEGPSAYEDGGNSMRWHQRIERAIERLIAETKGDDSE